MNKKSLNLEEISINCDNVINNKESCEIKKEINKLIHICSSSSYDEEKSFLYYLLANLYLSLHDVISDENNLLHLAINYFRQSLHINSDDNVKTNLANALIKQNRTIEALDYYNQVQLDFTLDNKISNDAPYVATFQKALLLKNIAEFLTDKNYCQSYTDEYVCLIKSLKPYLKNIGNYETLKARISQELEIVKEYNNVSINEEIYSYDEEYSKEEILYREWCKNNKLFLNPLNDITISWFVDRDTLQFPNYSTKLNEGPLLAAGFSDLKRDYCFARFLAYEGVNKIDKDYENRSLFLVKTNDDCYYNGYVCKLKTAYRICFGVLDSIAKLLYRYFGDTTEDKQRSIAFTSKQIKDLLKPENNCYINAIYWLACDLFNNEKIYDNSKKWKAPKPYFSEIKNIRDHLEHGWVRIYEGKEKNNYNQTSHDYAYRIDLTFFEKELYNLLKLVRTAIIYSTFAIKLNEKKKDSSSSLEIPIPMCT